MAFRKGQRVELRNGPAWLPCVVTFVWRAVELETGRRCCRYDVRGEGFEGLRIGEEYLRGKHAARGRRRVLRSHSLTVGAALDRLIEKYGAEAKVADVAAAEGF